MLRAGENMPAASPLARPGPLTSQPVVFLEVLPYNIRAEPSGVVGPSCSAGSRTAAPRQLPSAAASKPPPDAEDSRPGSPVPLEGWR